MKIGRRTRRESVEGGFTLIEALIVLAIVVALTAVAMPAYESHMQNTRIGTAAGDIVSISRDILQYQLDHNSYPASLDQIGPVPEDPWGNEYQYLNMSLAEGNGKKRKDHNLVPINTDYDLYSKGPDGRSVSPLTAKPSKDDIIRANNGSFIGVASEY